jgi:hypothetical protein
LSSLAIKTLNWGTESLSSALFELFEYISRPDLLFA